MAEATIIALLLVFDSILSFFEESQSNKDSVLSPQGYTTIDYKKTVPKGSFYG